MRPIDIAHSSPRDSLGAFIPTARAHAAGVPVSGSVRINGDSQGVGSRLRGSDFLHQAFHARVITALQSNYPVSATVPYQGTTPAESTGQFLAGAASQTLAPGGKGVDQLRESVESSLQDAASLVQTLGAADGDINTLVDNIRAQLELFIDAAVSALSGGSTQESTGPAPEYLAAAGARLTRTEKTRIEFVTQEGDTVRLSLRSRLDVSAVGVESASPDGVYSAAAVNLISGSKLQISVEGNLNDDELAAIRDVLAKVEVLAEDFFQGNVQEAFAAAADLDVDAGQLASVALDLSLKQRLRVSGFVHTAPVAPLIAPAPEAPLAAPAPIAPDTAVPEPAATGSEPLPGADPAAAVSAPADAAAAPVSATPPDSALSPGFTISGYLRQVLDSLRESGSPGQGSGSWRFKIELLYAAVSADAAQPSARASEAAVNKLGEALTSLA